MDAVDRINRRFARGSLGLGFTRKRATPVWAMRQKSLSPRYTTSLTDLPTATCN